MKKLTETKKEELRSKAWEEFKRIRDSAYDEYEKIWDSAYAEYTKRCEEIDKM
jgi:vacuolar-type H+-ATPase subunit E/Vma4